MYKSILVPLAFDDEHTPERALNVARTLASDDAKITLVHVMADVPAYAISYMPEGFSEGTRTAVEDTLAKLAATLPNADTILTSGNPAGEILRIAEDRGSDCIVIASHRPGFGDFLIGSTAARVVRHAQCSVMVLR